MPVTSRVLFRGAATTNTATVLYTTPANTQAVVTNILVSNISTTDRTFSLFLNGVAINLNSAIPANSSAFIDLKQVLNATNTITGGVSATGVNFHISGVEIA